MYVADGSLGRCSVDSNPSSLLSISTSSATAEISDTNVSACTGRLRLRKENSGDIEKMWNLKIGGTTLLS